MRKALSDLEINSRVRKILIRHWMDLGHVSIRTSRGQVSVFGVLRKLPMAAGKLTAQLVGTIFSEIAHVPSVARVKPHLENWEEVNGRWRLTAAGKAMEAAGEAGAPDKAERAHNLDEWVRLTGDQLRKD